MRGQPAEQIRAQHRCDESAEAAARLAGHAAMLRGVEGAVARVHPRHHVVAQVGVVVAGAGGVDELRTAVQSPGIDEDHDRRRSVPAAEHAVRGFDEREPVRRPVVPHGQVAGVTLQHVDAGIALVGVVVPGRYVDVERPVDGIAQRIATQGFRCDDVPVESAGQLGGPGERHARPLSSAEPGSSERSAHRNPARRQPVSACHAPRPPCCRTAALACGYGDSCSRAPSGAQSGSEPTESRA